MKPLNLRWLSRRRDTVLPILLASVALLLSCDRRTSELLAPEPEQVTVLPRFAAGTTVPEVGWVKASLTVNSVTSDIKVQYQKNKVISLGTVPVNSSFTLSLAGYDSLDGQIVLRWWGSVAGSAGTEATKSVTITPETVKTSSALADVLTRLDVTPNVGDTLELGGDTLFYAASPTDPRTMAIPSIATKSFVFKDTGAAQVAYRSVTGGQLLWSELITVTVKAKDDTTTTTDTTKSDTSTAIRTLTAMPGNWTNAFDSIKSSWSLSVSHKTTSIQFKADLASGKANLTINGNSTKVGTDTALAISQDTNTFDLAVTNGAVTRLCTLTVVRRDSVTAPTFDSAGGWYLEGFKVKLLANGHSDTIRYTMDGTEPTSTSDVYTGPISAVSDSFVIKAISFRAGDSSSVASATFRIAHEDKNNYGIPWNEALTKGRLIDARDGQVYRTVVINGKTWMAQNLNYRIPGSSDDTGVCLSNIPANCLKYGRLYRWAAALNEDSAGNVTTILPVNNSQGICPSDWHIPTTEEWDGLRQGADSVSIAHGLKSTAGWDSIYFDSEWAYHQGMGSDSIGFRGVPAGFSSYNSTALPYGYRFSGSNNSTYWWSSTQNPASASDAGFRKLVNDNKVTHSFSGGYAPKKNRHSIRCIKNTP